MSQIGFYHLTRTSPDQALPDLLGRTLALGERAVVRCASDARVAELDRALWAAERPDWLPHGSERTGHAALQPIWLTARDERPNGATFLFLLDGTEADASAWTPSAWTRVFDLFDGRDDQAVTAARQRWIAAKAAGHERVYWKQTDKGWEKA